MQIKKFQQADFTFIEWIDNSGQGAVCIHEENTTQKRFAGKQYFNADLYQFMREMDIVVKINQFNIILIKYRKANN